MKVRDFLNSAAKYLTENKNETYSVKCFNYPVEYVGMGTHSDFPVEFYEPELEGVICIAKDDFDVEQIFQGYLCYPEEYPEFYKSTDFILCFGPEKDLDFEKILDSEIDLKNQIFYGLDENQINKILNKYVINENLNDSQRKISILIQSAMPKKDTSDSQRKMSILIQSAMPKKDTSDSQNKRSILVQSSIVTNKNQKPKVRVLIKK